MIGVKYGAYDMQANGCSVTDTTVHSAPQKTIQSEKLAETDGAIAVKSTYEAKTFTVDGQLSGSSIAALDSLQDVFKAALNIEAQNFDVDYAGGTRRYVATPQNIMISRPRGLDTCTFSVEFYCPSPVGMDTYASTLLAATGITSNTAQPAITVGGSYQAEPLIILTLTAVTGGTAKTVTIQNGTTLRGVSITRNWLPGDVLEIDCLNKLLYVNNAVVPFSGQFPRWDVGAGTISYLDDFTTRSASLTAAYTRRYL